MFFTPIIPYVDPSRKMIDMITSLGLASGLQLCLDAGDLNSYASGQTWEDVSGNGYDFLRGSTSSSQATDPTFNGTPGGDSSSEYWSFDGGDYFTLGQSNPAWVNNIHKNNATVTFAAWVNLALGSQQFLSGTFNPSSGPMFEWDVNAAGALSYAVGDGSGPPIYDHQSTATINASAWTFIATSVDEAGNAIMHQIGATQENASCTYPGPSSSNAGNIIKVGADGDGFGPLLSGGRLAAFMAWSSKLSDSDLLALYNATKSKFGL